MNINVYYQKINFKYDFPIFYSTVKTSLPDDGKLNWHEEIEIKRITEGNQKIVIGSKSMDTIAGDIVLINPYEPHSIKYQQENTVQEVIIFNIKYFQDKIIDTESKSNFAKLSEGTLKFKNIIRDPKVDEAFTMLSRELKHRSSNYMLTLISLSIYLLCMLLETSVNNLEKASSTKEMDNLKKLQPAIHYINDNINKDINLDLLADACNISSNYFSRLFKKTFSVNVLQYVNEVRMRKAEMLLLTTDKKIKDIALETGFNYESYFTRWFKSQKSISPRDYRENKTTS